MFRVLKEKTKREKRFKVINEREGIRRLGILTEREKEHLREKKPINFKIKSKLYSKLDKRMAYIYEDFEIMLRSPHLEPWRLRNGVKLFGNYLDVVKQLGKLASITKTLYISPVQYYWRGKKRVYWIDRSIDENNYDVSKYFFKASDPDFALRKIKKYVKDESILNRLREAVAKDVLPDQKDKAITVEQITLLFREGKVSKTKWSLLEKKNGKLKLQDPNSKEMIEIDESEVIKIPNKKIS